MPQAAKRIQKAALPACASLRQLAPGCRGSLSEQLMKEYKLREGVSPQHYGLGVKEVWEIPAENHQPGTVTHTIGWPMDLMSYAGSDNLFSYESFGIEALSSTT